MTPTTTIAAAALLLSGASALADPLSLTSPDLAPGARVADRQVGNDFGCMGGDQSPALVWRGAPAQTKSFAVALFDSDARGGAGFWHWMLIDIPAAATSLAANAGDPKSGVAPTGAIETRNSAGKLGYFGPCPPPGAQPHHYNFMVFALDVKTAGLAAGANAADAAAALEGHTLAKATLTGIFGR